jgi:hypothetical protein
VVWRRVTVHGSRVTSAQKPSAHRADALKGLVLKTHGLVAVRPARARDDRGRGRFVGAVAAFAVLVGRHGPRVLGAAPSAPTGRPGRPGPKGYWDAGLSPPVLRRRPRV